MDLGFGSGQGMKCYHSEHLYGELWHRAFIVSPDTPRTQYVISCGHNVEASGGVAGVWRQANARTRGLKRVQVEPHLSVTGAVSAEWVPIKPKTDAAFLFSIIHSILHEHPWRDVCDVPFLSDDTNSPYLVGPNGYYLRDAQTRKPLIWDLADGAAKPFDSDIKEPALDGAYQARGVEIGADDEVWEYDSVDVKPSFQLLIDHVKEYSPEWAADECDIPAERIRRIASEYLAHACVGETIEIEGRVLPYRPVAVMLGKTVNNGWGGYECCWARTACLPGWRPRSTRRAARHQREAGASRRRSHEIGGPRRGRADGPSLQRNLEGGVAARSAYSQRLFNVGPTGCKFAVVARAWAGPSTLVVSKGTAG